MFPILFLLSLLHLLKNVIEHLCTNARPGEKRLIRSTSCPQRVHSLQKKRHLRVFGENDPVQMAVCRHILEYLISEGKQQVQLRLQREF
jgi:hypothetical protein